MSQKQNIRQTKNQNINEEKGSGLGSFFIFFGGIVAVVIILGLLLQFFMN
jgi:hypothetical protein